ncbi:MAG: hypothetical protein JW751_07275 [Polyangiaceae bacterium]|nr:hypothetical protein [Polyangiaceae bacterium]
MREDAAKYEQRRPEQGALSRVVRDNLRTPHDAIEHGFAAPLPTFVRNGLEAFVRCGVLACSFALLACPDYGRGLTVGFSCRGRGFTAPATLPALRGRGPLRTPSRPWTPCTPPCPSCLGRRMASTAFNLVDPVIPPRAPLHQLVLTLPFELRARVVPPPPADEHDGDGGVAAANAKPPTHRGGYRPWRELLKRTLRIDVEQCDRSGARPKLRALLLTSARIERCLHWLGEPSEPPPLTPSRDPPFFKSPVIRRLLGGPVPAELFDAH